jgi:hypothetical protein
MSARFKGALKRRSDMEDTIEKAQEIAAEAVGQARGATLILKSSIEDWFAEA